MFRKGLKACLGALLLAGCTDVGNAAKLSSGPVVTTSVNNAVQAFVSICYEAHPSFEQAEAIAARIGFTERLPTGPILNPDAGMSLKVFVENDRNICSVSFVTDEPASAYRARMRTPFNAALFDMPNGSKRYLSRLDIGGIMMATTGIKTGSVTLYELTLATRQ